MRFLLVPVVATLIASCAAHPIPNQKLATQGSNVRSSPLFVARSPNRLIEARTLRIALRNKEEWLLHLAIEREDGRAPGVKAAYALGSPMPYTPILAEGARESGYIQMSKEIFKALSESGLEVDLLDSEDRLHNVKVPARIFAHFLE